MLLAPIVLRVTATGKMRRVVIELDNEVHCAAFWSFLVRKSADRKRGLAKVEAVEGEG